MKNISYCSENYTLKNVPKTEIYLIYFNFFEKNGKNPKY